MAVQRWLHISDLHFGYEPYTVKKMREQLLLHVKEIEPVDFLFITGDLRYAKTEATDYPKATIDFINGLQKSLNINSENTFLVPGNHDVNRSDELETLVKSAKEKYLTKTGKISKGTIDYIQKCREPFLSLYEKICSRKEPAIHYSIETNFFNIIHLNTAFFFCMEGEDGDLIVGSSLVSQIEKMVNKIKPSIVLAHHDFSSLRTDEQRQLEIILKDFKAVLYLCGHKHVAYSHNMQTARQNQNLWVYLCGTNMDASHLLDTTDMDFFVGEIDTDTLHGHIQAYKWSTRNSVWMPDQDFSFPQDGRIDGKHYFPPEAKPDLISPLSTDSGSKLLRAYYEYLQFECGGIQLSGLPIDINIVQKKIDLDKIFVPLFFKKTNVPQNGESIQSDLEPALNYSYSIDEIIPENSCFLLSILAGPGGGKTTLLKWVISNYCLPSDYNKNNPLMSKRVLFPIWIKCRDIDFSSYPTVLEIISEIPRRAELMMSANSDEVFFRVVHKHIEDGSVLLAIDGLDEIANEKERIYFINQLEKFVFSNPSVNVILTSRTAGFNAISAYKLINFECYEILPFSDTDIRRLCVEWYKVVDGDRIEIHNKAIDLANRILGHRNIRLLAGNPLLLTTLLLVKRRVGILPTKRIVLYSEAIKVLLESWNREAYQPLDLDEVRYQLAYIAYQMMVDNNQVVTRTELRHLLKKAREELKGLVSGNNSINDFIKNVERRSELLIQKGHEVISETGKIEPIYEFQHLTFQEYLAAYAIAEKCYPNAKKNDKPFEIMKDYLTDESMREVVLLTAVSLDRFAVEELVDGIIRLKGADDTKFKKAKYLRALLLQIVADEARLTKEKSHEIFRLCFDPGIQSSDIDILRTLANGKYSTELDEYLNKQDKRSNAVRCLFPFLRDNNKFNAYEYYIDHRNSSDNDVVLNAISCIAIAFWMQAENVCDSLTKDQRRSIKEDLFVFATHEDSRLQFEALETLRTADLISKNDFNRYLKLIVLYINKTNKGILRLEPYPDDHDDLILKYNKNVLLSKESVELVKKSIFEIRVESIDDYHVMLTHLLLLIFYSDEDNLDDTFEVIINTRNQISNKIDLFDRAIRIFRTTITKLDSPEEKNFLYFNNNDMAIKDAKKIFIGKQIFSDKQMFSDKNIFISPSFIKMRILRSLDESFLKILEASLRNNREFNIHKKETIRKYISDNWDWYKH